MSEHQSAVSPEITFTTHHDDSIIKRFMKVTWILSIITIIELFFGFGLAKHWFGYSHTVILFIKGVICILSLLKAYYIVGVFMHLGDELKNFRMTIITTLAVFVWFIIAFLSDGTSWKNLRNTNAGTKEYIKTEEVKPAAAKEGAKD
jgi:cytochrome c oxidase subunit IV